MCWRKIQEPVSKRAGRWQCKARARVGALRFPSLGQEGETGLSVLRAWGQGTRSSPREGVEPSWHHWKQP